MCVRYKDEDYLHTSCQKCAELQRCNEYICRMNLCRKCCDKIHFYKGCFQCKKPYKSSANPYSYESRTCNLTGDLCEECQEIIDKKLNKGQCIFCKMDFVQRYEFNLCNECIKIYYDHEKIISLYKEWGLLYPSTLKMGQKCIKKM